MKKLTYLLFIIPLFFVTNVKAANYTLTFNYFNTTYGNLSNTIQCNNTICASYTIPLRNVGSTSTYVWGVNNAPSCTSSATVQGAFQLDNNNFGIINSDFSFSRVYIVTSSNAYDCAFTVSDGGTNFSCVTPTLATDFRIAFTLYNNFGSETTFNMGINRAFNINCDTTTGAIINNQNINTQNIINNDNQNTQNIIQSQEEIAQATRGVNANLTSEADPNTSSSLSGFQNSLASDTPITDLLTMPLTLINAYISGMNSSCTPYNFGSLLGTNLTMPCINLQQRLGSNIWTIIDVLFSIFMIFNISKLFIGAFNNFTSLKDDFSNMYTNDYEPKHGGGE